MKKIQQFLRKLARKNINSDLLFLSEQLALPGRQALLFVEFFEDTTLDYSLNSLRHIDAYLLQVQQHYRLKKGQFSDREKQEFSSQMLSIILRAGAYIGETLREHDQAAQWDWIASKLQGTESPALPNKAKTENQNCSAILTDGEKFEFPMDIAFNLILSEDKAVSAYDYVNALLKNPANCSR